jgi:hypothetical protein
MTLFDARHCRLTLTPWASCWTNRRLCGWDPSPLTARFNNVAAAQLQSASSKWTNDTAQYRYVGGDGSCNGAGGIGMQRQTTKPTMAKTQNADDDGAAPVVVDENKAVHCGPMSCAGQACRCRRRTAGSLRVGAAGLQAFEFVIRRFRRCPAIVAELFTLWTRWCGRWRIAWLLLS